jgi:hypothetical protein
MKKMYIFRKCLMAIAVMLLSFAAQGQFNYVRSTFTGTYAPISTGSGATVSTATGTATMQTNVPIGFTFTYNAIPYTTLHISPAGYVSFVSTTNSTVNTNLFSTTAPNATLAPYYDNLTTAALGTNPAGSILYQTQGLPGARTFTVQWTNVSSFSSTTNGQPASINFQVILYEGTNVIEFTYGSFTGAGVNTSESASIGIESQAGGQGNFIDAISASSYVSNSMMNTRKRPNMSFYRFTPASPLAPLPGGSYTVGVGGMFNSLTEAAAEINQRGIGGPVNLQLIDAQYDTTAANGAHIFPILFGPVAGTSSSNTITIQPLSGTSTIVHSGSPAGNIGNATATTFTSTEEPIIAFIGTDYVTMSNINFTTVAPSVVDRGFLVANSSATDGAQNNTFSNISVTLSRTNTSSRGIMQDASPAPTAASGSNSSNKYYNITVSNVYCGIHLNGVAAFPDAGNEIGTTGAGTTTIGANTPNDLGGSTTTAFGIKATNQSGVSIFNTTVRNITNTGTADVDGIFLDAVSGTSEAFNNHIYNIRNTSATSTSPEITGIRSNVAITTGGNVVRIYNNFIYGLTSGYTGAASAIILPVGIFVQPAGSGAGNTQNIDFNSVAIDNSVAPNISSTALAIGTSSGVTINVRNNILANYTGAQTGVAAHYTWVSTAAASIGNTGSISNYNDLYIDNTTNGYTGLGNTTQYATLANWQAAMNSDANSIQVNPGFIDITSDLHVTGNAVNGMANMTGITWVTTDIDNQVRNAPHDIGADDYTPAALDMGITALVSPVITTTGCYTNSENVTVTIQNFAATAIDFSVNPVTVTVNVTGAATQTFSVTLNNNSLNSGNPLAAGGSINVALGTLNMTTAGTYTFNGSTSLTGDAVIANDALDTEVITISAGTASASSLSVCAGNSVTLNVAGATGTLQWQHYDANTATWVNETGTGNTTASYTVTPSDTTDYRMLVCGMHPSNTVTVEHIDAQPPVVSNGSRCGSGPVSMNATANGTIAWYTAATGGAPVFTGSTYTPTLTASATYYAENQLGAGVRTAGLAAPIANSGYSASVEGLKFNVITPITIQTVDVYPQNSGNITIQLKDASNAVINSIVAPVTGGYTVNTVTLNFPVPVGTGYQLIVSTYGAGLMYRENPFTAWGTLPNAGGAISITGGAAINAYYYFYNWKVTAPCVSPRVPVTATINYQPVVNLGPDAAVCADSALVLNAGNPGHTYTWSTAESTQTIAPTASGTYSVLVSTAQSCFASDTINVVVSPNPVISLGADITQCEGSVTLNANNAGPGYAWSTGNTAQSISVNTTGNYSVAVTDGNGCVGRDTVMVTINPNPIVNLGADSSFCVGSTIMLDAGNAGMNYVWAHGPATQMVSISTADTFAVTVINPATGCQGIDSVITSLDALPVVNLGADVSQCGGTVMLDANNTGSSFAWSTAASTQTITVSSTGNYAAAVTNAAGCTSSDTVMVTINPVPAVNLGPDITQCGPSISISAGNPGALSYAWSSGATTQLATFTSSGSYSVLVTNPQNCSSSDTIVITLNPYPVPDAGLDTTICPGSSVTLDAGAGYASYTWTVGNFTATTQTITVSPGTSTTYTLSVTSMAGCTSTNTDDVTVNIEQTTASFTHIVTSGNLVNFSNTSSSTMPYTSVWDFGDGNTSNTPNAQHTYTANGTYNASLTITNACGSYTVVQQVIVTGVGVDEAGMLKEIKVYPNPSDGIFNLEISNINAEKLNVSIIDLTGRVIFESTEEARGDYKKNIDLSAFAKGVYYLRLQAGSSTDTRKLVIQ